MCCAVTFAFIFYCSSIGFQFANRNDFAGCVKRIPLHKDVELMMASGVSEVTRAAGS